VSWRSQGGRPRASARNGPRPSRVSPSRSGAGPTRAMGPPGREASLSPRRLHGGRRPGPGPGCVPACSGGRAPRSPGGRASGARTPCLGARNAQSANVRAAPPPRGRRIRPACVPASVPVRPGVTPTRRRMRRGKERDRAAGCGEAGVAEPCRTSVGEAPGGRGSRPFSPAEGSGSRVRGRRRGGGRTVASGTLGHRRDTGPSRQRRGGFLQDRVTRSARGLLGRAGGRDGSAGPTVSADSIYGTGLFRYGNKAF
jgi:hypothetical protein